MHTTGINDVNELKSRLALVNFMTFDRTSLSAIIPEENTSRYSAKTERNDLAWIYLTIDSWLRWERIQRLRYNPCTALEFDEVPSGFAQIRQKEEQSK